MSNPLDLSAYTVKPSTLNKPELIVLYGPAGGGKSYLAATISEVEGMAPVLIIDTEGSTAGTLHGFDDDLIDILPVHDHATFEQITTALLEREHKYNTVIIDTADVAQERAIEHFLEEWGASNTFKAWGDVKSWTNGLARKFKAANFLGIMVFHETIDRTDSGAVLGRSISLSGSAKEIMPGIPDVVGWVTRKVDKTLGREATTVEFSPDPKKATKNRFELPEKMVDARMSDIFDHISKREEKK